MTALTLAEQLHTRFGSLLAEPVQFRNEVSITIKEAERIAEVCAFAKGQLGFDYLVDVSSVDNWGEDPRFTVVYELYSHTHHGYLRLKIQVSEEKLEAPTISNIWRAAEWHEREVYDMMGLRFHGHPDLRRILMWEGYPYYPLRKDFPLAGKPTDLPEVAFTSEAPLEGGPFVTIPGGNNASAREPRVRLPEK